MPDTDATGSTTGTRPPLAGRTALVTGGSRGIGAAVAQRLAADGAAVALTYRRDADAAARTVERITGAGGTARAYRAPIDDPDAVLAALEAIEADLGPVDLLVSNAGTASRGRAIADTEDAEYLQLLRVHVLGPLTLVRALLPQLRAAGRSDVVVISSTILDQVPAGGAPYAMAKAALEAAARTLAAEERGHGVRVNIVAPGLVVTDMGERLVAATAGGATIGQLDEVYPFGRVARPEDVAGVVAFLASADADYLTAQRIRVDGGGPPQRRCPPPGPGSWSLPVTATRARAQRTHARAVQREHDRRDGGRAGGGPPGGGRRGDRQ